MKQFRILIFLMLVAVALPGCVGVTQTISAPTLPAQPTPGPTIPPLPTRIIVTLPSPSATAPASEPTLPAASVSPESGAVITDPTLLKLVDEAKTDLTTRANVPLDAITVVSAEPVEWRDASLGCPMPDQMYAQMITPGYLIVLEANGEEYNYHASMDRVIWCDK